MLSIQAETIFWHQFTLHCGPHSMQQAHEFVDVILNLLKFNFYDILKCPTCLKNCLIKSSAVHKSLYGSIEQSCQELVT